MLNARGHQVATNDVTWRHDASGAARLSLNDCERGRARTLVSTLREHKDHQMAQNYWRGSQIHQASIQIPAVKCGRSYRMVP